jgi:hypothetical protein
MAIEYGADVFSLAPGQSIGLFTVFNSSDFNAGGDYLGPMVIAAAAVSSPNQTLTPSTVGVEWKAQSSDLTTNCVYHYSVRNDGSDNASFTLHFFHN